MEISYSSWPWHRSDATALAGYANMMMMMMMLARMFCSMASVAMAQGTRPQYLDRGTLSLSALCLRTTLREFRQQTPCYVPVTMETDRRLWSCSFIPRYKAAVDILTTLRILSRITFLCNNSTRQFPGQIAPNRNGFSFTAQSLLFTNSLRDYLEQVRGAKLKKYLLNCRKH